MTRFVLPLAALFGLAQAPSAPAPPAAATADPPKVEGSWIGSMKVTDDVSLRLVFHIKKGDKGYSATMDSPDQGAKGLEVEKATYEKDTLTLAIPKIGASYTGKVAEGGKKIVGKFKQGTREFDLDLAPASDFDAALEGKPDEYWVGTINAGGGIELKLVLNLYKQKDGSFRATLDSPDQGAKGLGVSEVKLDKEKMTLSFKAKAIGAEYSGKLNDAGDEATGDFKQLGGSTPLKLEKKDKVTEAARPQTPKGPFPYRSLEVAYPNPKAGITLAGTLTLPEGRGPFPAALLITGSGAQDRDETLFGHKPFLVIADYLTRRGVAVLRVDDRGVGKSTGDPKTATSADFATDVAAGVDYLKTRPEVDARRIGLIGHSEGGLIAPMVAFERPDDVAFLVLLAGPGVPGDEILLAQAALIRKAMGAPAESIARGTEASRKIYEALRNEKDEAALEKTLKALAAQAIAGAPDAERKAAEAAGPQAVEANLAMLKTPWFRYFLTFDPRPTLAKVKCPVLALNGEKDLQVPPAQNLPEIAKALGSAGNTRVTTRELPGLNHLFQTCKTGAPGEYAKIEETFAPDALKAMGDWIVELK